MTFKWISKLRNAFTPKALAPDEQTRRLVARMSKPGGRDAFLAALAADPSLANARDRYGFSALSHAAGGGDVEAMSRIMEAGADRQLFRDAIYWAAVNASQPALDLLVAKGGVVEQEYHIHRIGDIAYADTKAGLKCREGIKMLVAIRDAQKKTPPSSVPAGSFNI